jgi:transposase InsO family protein
VIVSRLVGSRACSLRAACEAAGLAPSSYYYRSRPRQKTPLLAALQQEAGEHPTYGSRRLTHQLRRWPHRYRVNRKRVQRLMRQNGLLRRPKRAQIPTTDSRHSYRRYPNLVAGMEIVRPNQVWVGDITYIRLGRGFVYLAVLMDVFSRAIRGWSLSRVLDTRLTLTALQAALRAFVPEVHHSDQGIHYAATEYVSQLDRQQVRISMTAKGRPEQNGYAERLMRTIKEEEVDLSEYRDFADAHRQIGRFMEEVYMNKRIHSALGYLTPAEFETSRRSQMTPTHR